MSNITLLQTKMVGPTLQIILDGDHNKAYQRGEKVTGRVIFVVENKQKVDSLKVDFVGSCVTRTTRPFHVNSNNDAAPARRTYEEKVRLFHREQELTLESCLNPGKYARTFEFTFPESTEQRYKKPSQGSTVYLREPHLLPPSFQLATNASGGAAQISYFLQARLSHPGSKCTESRKHMVQYQPALGAIPLPEAKVTSAALYGQIWKPSVEKGAESRTALNKVLSRRLKSNGPRIVPYLSHPNQVVPGQHIPLSLTLVNTRDALDEPVGDSMLLDSLCVTISTYSTVISGHNVTYPEDIVTKHVKCIIRNNMNKPLVFGKARALTTNFRLIDDGECIPSFRTYMITRRYEMTISIGIKYNDQKFTIKSKTPLEILPRAPGELLFTPVEHEIDPLPLYVPRDPDSESAPTYESLFAHAESSSSSEEISFGLSDAGSSSPPLSGASTPASVSEDEELRLGDLTLQPA